MSNQEIVIDKAYMLPIVHKLVSDIQAKELDYGMNGAKVSISLGFKEAMVLLNALKGLLPTSATNGEIMQTIFPNIKVKYEGVVVSVKGLDRSIDNPLGERTFWRDWWDAPYEEVQHETND